MLVFNQFTSRNATKGLIIELNQFFILQAAKKCLCILFIFSEKRNKNIFLEIRRFFLGHKFLEMFRYFCRYFSDNFFCVCDWISEYFNMLQYFDNI